MTTNPQITRAVQFALLSGAAGAALQAPAAFAQDNELEQVVVTGSRIRRVDSETASPVFTLDKNAIAESGVNTIGDLVQQIPSISGAIRPWTSTQTPTRSFRTTRRRRCPRTGR